MTASRSRPTEPAAPGAPVSSAPAPADPLARILWWGAGLLAVAVLAALLYRGWPLLHPDIAERAPLNPACDLRGGPCTVTFAGGGAVTLALAPQGIPAVHPLTVEVRLAGLPPPERVELDFMGVDMPMGYNRNPLQPARDADAPPAQPDAGQAPGIRYTGSAMLPVCVRERMTWEARVLLYLPGRLLAAPFRFDSERP